MPRAGNTRAGELHRMAAHAHEKAAVSHEQGDHLNAHELTGRASERSREVEAHMAQLLKEKNNKEKNSEK